MLYSINMVKEIKKSKAKSQEAPKKKQLSTRFSKLKVKKSDLVKRGIIYIGHLPKGFNEDELKKFFTQFGDISRIRVSRSPKVSRIF